AHRFRPIVCHLQRWSAATPRRLVGFQICQVVNIGDCSLALYFVAKSYQVTVVFAVGQIFRPDNLHIISLAKACKTSLISEAVFLACLRNFDEPDEVYPIVVPQEYFITHLVYIAKL